MLDSTIKSKMILESIWYLLGHSNHASDVKFRAWVRRVKESHIRVFISENNPHIITWFCIS